MLLKEHLTVILVFNWFHLSSGQFQVTTTPPGGLVVLVEEAVEEFVLDHLAEIVTTTFFLIGLWHLKEIRRDLSSAQVELSAIDSKLNGNLNANTNSTNQSTPVRYQNSFKATGVLSNLWTLMAQILTPDSKVKKTRKVRSVP